MVQDGAVAIFVAHIAIHPNLHPQRGSSNRR
jgi:hypothetical protein